MTRVQQWIKRRNAYKARTAKYLRKAPHAPYLAYGFHLTYDKHRARAGYDGVWGMQPPPRVSLKTWKAQKPPRFPVNAIRQYTISPADYKEPPHVTLGHTPSLPPGWHFRFEVIRFHIQPVQIVKTLKGRPRAFFARNKAAHCYFRKVGKWPDWDPKARTPVDVPTLGPDDAWEPH